MGRSQESFNKKEVRKQKDKKRKDKETKRQAKKENEKKSSFDDMIAYVDEFGRITSTPPDPDKKSEIEVDSIEISVAKADPSAEVDSVRKGIVSFFNSSKGYGFITDMETKQSVFVHITNLLEPINESNIVNFEIEKGPKGPTAVRVKLFKNEQK